VSTILDALRRVESDRRRRAVNDHAHSSVVGPEPGLVPAGRSLSPWLRGAGVGLVIVAIAGAASFYGLRPGAGSADPASVAAAAPAPASVVASIPDREAESRPRPAPVAARAPRPEPTGGSPARPARPVDRASTASGAAPSRTGAPPSTARGTSVTPIAAFPEARMVPSSVSSAPPQSAPTRVVAAAAPPVEVAARRVPTPAAEPARTAVTPSRSESPTSSGTAPGDIATTVDRSAEVTVLRTIWHPSADRRIAQLRLEGEPASREVREGDFVEGYEIVEIKLSGVVFTRGGVTLERRVAAKRDR
jgi:hypothetical protein